MPERPTSTHIPSKKAYIVQTLTRDPAEFLRIVGVALTTLKFRFIRRCVGKGTTVEPGTTIINGINVRVGKNCLLKDSIYLRAGMQGRITIGDRAAINSFCRIYGHGTVTIGEDTQIGPGTIVTTTDHDYEQGLETRFIPVKIGNRVWIGANATILPGVSIGDNAVIGAGAVVTKDIPANSIAVGVPARVLRERAPSETR